jgi:para-nitrobenzyl esterase
VTMAGKYLEVLGLTGKDVDALRSMTFLQHKDAMKILGDIMREAEHRITPFQPLVDGKVIPEWPIEAVRKGSARGVTAIMGTNLEEWKLFAIMEPGFKDMDEAAMLSRLGGIIPFDLAQGMVAEYRKARQARGDDASPAEILTAIQTDYMFRMPVIRLVEAQRDNGQKVYNYLFNWKSPVIGGVLGACHALEIGFVFGQHDDMFCGTGPDADKLSKCMQDAWLAFARTGKPDCESIGKWPVYGDDRMTMVLGKDCHAEAATYDAERQAWDRIKMTYTKPI